MSTLAPSSFSPECASAPLHTAILLLSDISLNRTICLRENLTRTMTSCLAACNATPVSRDGNCVLALADEHSEELTFLHLLPLLHQVFRLLLSQLERKPNCCTAVRGKCLVDFDDTPSIPGSPYWHTDEDTNSRPKPIGTLIPTASYTFYDSPASWLLCVGNQNGTGFAMDTLAAFP